MLVVIIFFKEKAAYGVVNAQGFQKEKNGQIDFGQRGFSHSQMYDSFQKGNKNRGSLD